MFSIVGCSNKYPENVRKDIYERVAKYGIELDEEVEKCFSTIKSEVGKIDGLAHCIAFAKTEELAEIAMETQEVAVFNPHLTGSSFYDESDEEITEKFRIPESDIQNISYGGGKVELFMVYVFIALIAGFGAIMTRYFLTD